MALLIHELGGQDSFQQLEGPSEELFKMKGFCRKKGRASEILGEGCGEKGLFWSQDIFYSGEWKGKERSVLCTRGGPPKKPGMIFWKVGPL